MRKLNILLGLLAVGACVPNPDLADAATTVDASVDAASDAASSSDTTRTIAEEVEPNNGATVDEFNALALEQSMLGHIAPSNDADIFRFATRPGYVYQIHLTAPEGSLLQPHLTTMDCADDGSAGDDYIKIVRSTTDTVAIDTLALAHNYYYAVVRDSRNVIGSGGFGDQGFTYTIEVVEMSQAEYGTQSLSFTSTNSGTLAHAGAIDLYQFEAAAMADVRIDMHASGDVDGRMLVYSTSSADWIARNDNRSLEDPNPLIDAPLSGGGQLTLVVENITEDATSLAYTIEASM
jgi:hypothetical protein